MNRLDFIQDNTPREKHKPTTSKETTGNSEEDIMGHPDYRGTRNTPEDNLSDLVNRQEEYHRQMMRLQMEYDPTNSNPYINQYINQYEQQLQQLRNQQLDLQARYQYQQQQMYADFGRANASYVGMDFGGFTTATGTAGTAGAVPSGTTFIINEANPPPAVATPPTTTSALKRLERLFKSFAKGSARKTALNSHETEGDKYE